MNRFNLNGLLLIGLTFFLFQSCGENASSPSSKDDEDNLPSSRVVYNDVVNYQTNYLRSLQLASGAIKDNDSKDSKICPYFANFACLALLKDPNTSNVEEVKKYMLWYMSKLNNSRNHVTGGDEIPGSIYDYYGEAETTNGTYDSVDSYAATFLMLASEFAKSSADNKEWLREYVEKLTLISSAMEKCIDTDYNTMPGVMSTDDDDGLSVASYVYDVKYLMDNCEVNQGLRDAIWLKENHLISDDSGDFSALLIKNAQGIESELWKYTVYNWLDNDSDLAITNWWNFYPDATSQLYPALFGVIPPAGDRANKLYSEFNQNYPNWSKGKVYSGAYPWALVVYAAAVSNDRIRVEEYIKHIYSYNIKDEQKGWWYSLESAFVVLAIDEIVNSVDSSPFYISID